MDSIMSITDPFLASCVKKETFLDEHAELLKEVYFKSNTINTTELKFKNVKLWSKIWNKMALTRRLCRFFLRSGDIRIKPKDYIISVRLNN